MDYKKLKLEKVNLVKKIVYLLLFVFVCVSCSRNISITRPKSFKYTYGYLKELKEVKEKYQKDTINFAQITFDENFDNDIIDLELNNFKIYIKKRFTNSKIVNSPIGETVLITVHDSNLFCKFYESNDSICIGSVTKSLKIKFVINGIVYIKNVDPSKGKWFIISNHPPKRVHLEQIVRPPVFD
jgi:hypothetical protein